MADWNSGGGKSGADWNDGADRWNDSGNAGAPGFNDNYTSSVGDHSFHDNFDSNANGDKQNDEGGGACRNCGQDGHFARDCDQPRKPMACFNCGEEGHTKAECTQPRKFTGECRNCQETGHQARDCPKKLKVCKQCLQEDDHDTIDCKNRKVLDLSKIPDMKADHAWTMMKEASDERDIGDFKEALQIYSKAAPNMTYPRIEESLRRSGFKIFIIALKKEVTPTFTNVNLQGEVGKTYTIGFFTSATCQRPVLLEAWPKTPEENLKRLADAGIPLERGVPVCSNCKELGHVKRNCPQEPELVEGPKIICALCGEEGHRVRDCQQERRKPGKTIECRICGGDHKAAECENKPTITCRNCGEEGHMAKDCTNERVMMCNNCSKAGHISRECPEPKDWSKVKCKHCGEMGHASAARCKKPEDGDGLDNVQGDNGHNGDDESLGAVGWNSGASKGNNDTGGSTQNEWENQVGTSAPAAFGGIAW